jgi:DNA-directed RNA polymerase specialized sigma24 family protein
VGASSDRSRFDVVYREQFARLMRVAYLMMGSNAVAEDLVHDVFIRCSGRLDTVDDPASYLRA